MRRICIFNHKGGVGKTTTAINLAAGLSRVDKKVLLVDLDPQGNVDVSLKANAKCNIYDVMAGDVAIKDCIVNIAKNFDMIASKESLAKIEYYLAQDSNSAVSFSEVFSEVKGYDYLIIDCPPSLGLLNQKVLAFCTEAFVPVATDYLGWDAVRKMPSVIAKINEHYKHNIKMSLVIPTLFDRRNKICKEMLAAIQKDYGSIVANPVHYNSKLKEAPQKGKSIFKYAKSSSGARDYALLVEKVIRMESSMSEPEY